MHVVLAASLPQLSHAHRVWLDVRILRGVCTNSHTYHYVTDCWLLQPLVLAASLLPCTHLPHASHAPKSAWLPAVLLTE